MSFEHYQPPDKFCLSRCDKEETKVMLAALRKLTTTTWNAVYQQGGKGPNKTGLAPTPYKDHELKHVNRPTEISADLGIIGIRASEKSRIFGFRSREIYFVLWFDPNHEIVKA